MLAELGLATELRFHPAALGDVCQRPLVAYDLSAIVPNRAGRVETDGLAPVATPQGDFAGTDIDAVARSSPKPALRAEGRGIRSKQVFFVRVAQHCDKGRICIEQSPFGPA